MIRWFGQHSKVGRHRTQGQAVWVLLAAMTICCVVPAQGEIQVTAAVSEDIYVGEPFQYQVVIDGYNQPAKVDTTPLSPWSPKSLGGQNLSQQSITIINGRRTVQESRRYLMAWELTATQVGKDRLPAVTVEIDGTTYSTQPLAIDVRSAQTTDQIELDVTFSKTECYVGEPIIMTVRWSIGLRVVDYHFALPFLSDTDTFVVEELETPPGSGGKVGQITLDSGDTPVRQGQSSDGRTVILFGKVLIPQKPGSLALVAPAVSCKVDATQRPSRRSIFDSPFFDDRPRQYERYRSEAEPITLLVRELPAQGRLRNFSGLVGQYAIHTLAEPAQVNVGDPITLTVVIQGDYLKHITAPDLNAIEGFAEKFKISTEPSVPVIENGRKIFTQTIRAQTDSVTEVPPVGLSYFDVARSEYVTEYSQPIPLKVAPTKVASATEMVGGQSRSLVSPIETVSEGVAANYEGPRLFRNTAFSPAAALTQGRYVMVWGGPFGLFLVSLAIRIARRNGPERQQAKKRSGACPRAIRALHRLGRENESAGATGPAVGEILRQYIGDRFGRTAQSLTAQDCRAILAEYQVDDLLIERFCRILSESERSRFAGDRAEGDSTDLAAICQMLKELDKQTRK